MDQISFQNGLICGLATKGLVRSGELYQPLIYNDEDEYNFFYLDFRRVMEPFSIGMFLESIIVHDSVQLPVTSIAQAYSQNTFVPSTVYVNLSAGVCSNVELVGGAICLTSTIL